MRLLFFLSLWLSSFSSIGQRYYLFVGTYTSGKSEGIYVYEFNAATGKAKPVSSIRSKNPSYLVISPGGKYVYAVNENGSDQTGEASAFSFDRATGQLRFLNKQSTGGADPCYITENRSGKWIMIANYNGGNLAALRVRQDGSLDTLSELIQHSGSGPVTD